MNEADYEMTCAVAGDDGDFSLLVFPFFHL